MTTNSSTCLLLASLSLLLLFSGCNIGGTDGKQPSMSLSFAATNSGQSSEMKQESGTIKSSHLTVTEAKMLVRNVKFKSDIENDGIPDDSLDFVSDSFVVNLKLDGTVNNVAVNAVPAGQYDEIEFDVHKPEDNETPPDPDFKIGTSGDERFSIIISGTYNGQEFRYRSSENMKQEINLASPLTISESTDTVNVTLTVDVSKWFMDENGNPLDPTLADNRNAIDGSLERSFENAFRDDDQDGKED